MEFIRYTGKDAWQRELANQMNLALMALDARLQALERGEGEREEKEE